MKKQTTENRGRLNLNFNLDDEREFAAYHLLQQKSKSRRATAFITELVLAQLSKSESTPLTPILQNMIANIPVPPITPQDMAYPGQVLGSQQQQPQVLQGYQPQVAGDQQYINNQMPYQQGYAPPQMVPNQGYMQPNQQGQAPYGQGMPQGQPQGYPYPQGQQYYNPATQVPPQTQNPVQGQQAPYQQGMPFPQQNTPKADNAPMPRPYIKTIDEPVDDAGNPISVADDTDINSVLDFFMDADM